VAWVAEQFKMTKAKAAMVTGGAVVALGFGSVYSQRFLLVLFSLWEFVILGSSLYSHVRLDKTKEFEN